MSTIKLSQRRRWEVEWERKADSLHQALSILWSELAKVEPETEQSKDIERRLSCVQADLDYHKSRHFEEEAADHDFDEGKAERKGEI